MYESSLEQKMGTAGGTLLSILVNIQYIDMLTTTVLAAVGAAVSFSVSFLLDKLVKRFKR